MLGISVLDGSIGFLVLCFYHFLSRLLFSDIEISRLDFDSRLKRMLREQKGFFEFQALKFEVVLVFDDVFGEVFCHEQQRYSLIVQAHLLQNTNQLCEVAVSEFRLLQGVAS